MTVAPYVQIMFCVECWHFKQLFKFLDEKVFVTTTTTKLFSKNYYLRLSLWVYYILSSLLLLPLPKSTSVFLCLSSHYYPGLGFHYASLPLEVFIGHVQIISTGVGQAFSC